MSNNMNVYDYSAALADSKKDYYEALKESKKANKQEMDNLSKSQKVVQERQREVYDKSLDAIRNDGKDRFDSISNKNQEMIQKKAQEYQKSLAAEREKFSEERQVAQKDKVNDLENLKRSFDKAYKREISNNQENRDNMAQQYKQKVAQRDKAYGENIEDLNRLSNDKSKEQATNHSTEKKRIVNKNNDHLEEVHKINTKEKDDVGHLSALQMDQLRKSNAEDIMNRDQTFKGQKKELEGQYFNSLGRQQESFNRVAEKGSEQAKVDNLKNERSFDQDMRELKGDFRNQMIAKDQKLKAIQGRTKDDTSYVPVKDLDKVKADSANSERKILMEMTDVQEKNDKAFQFQNQKNKESIRDMGIAQQDQMRDQENAFRDRIKGMALQDADEKNIMTNRYAQKLNEQETFFENSMNSMRRSDKNKWDGYQKQFNDTIEMMSNQRQETVKALNEGRAEEVDKLVTDGNQKVFELNRDLKNKETQKLAMKDKHIESIQMQNDTDQSRVVKSTDDKLERMTKESTKEIQFLNQHKKDQRIHDLSQSLSKLRIQSTNYETQLEKKELDAGKKIQSLESKYETRLIEQKDKYEEQITRIMNEFSAEKSRMAQLHKETQAQMRSNYQQDLTKTINQYEERISTMKLQNEMHVRELNRTLRQNTLIKESNS